MLGTTRKLIGWGETQGTGEADEADTGQEWRWVKEGKSGCRDCDNHDTMDI